MSDFHFRLNPNIGKNITHFVFYDYVCVAVSDVGNQSVIGMPLADFLFLHGIVFPDNATYMFIRTHGHEYKICETGAIINLYITNLQKK